MDGQRDDREGGEGVSRGADSLFRAFTIMMCYGLAALLGVTLLLHKSRSEDYEGLALFFLGFVLIPLWIGCAVLAHNYWVKTAFWIAVSPIILLITVIIIAAR